MSDDLNRIDRIKLWAAVVPASCQSEYGSLLGDSHTPRRAAAILHHVAAIRGLLADTSSYEATLQNTADMFDVSPHVLQKNRDKVGELDLPGGGEFTMPKEDDSGELDVKNALQLDDGDFAATVEQAIEVAERLHDA